MKQQLAVSHTLNISALSGGLMLGAGIAAFLVGSLLLALRASPAFAGIGAIAAVLVSLPFYGALYDLFWYGLHLHSRPHVFMLFVLGVIVGTLSFADTPFALASWIKLRSGFRWSEHVASVVRWVPGVSGGR